MKYVYMNRLLLGISSLFLFNCVPNDSIDLENEQKSQEVDIEASANVTLAISDLCSSCDFVIAPTTGKFIGTKEGVQAGDVICLSGEQKYGRITFDSIIGTENNPIVIRNCNGQAVIESDASFGLRFTESKHFKLVGDGGGDYGIKVSTEKGFFVSMERKTTNFEIAQIEVAGFEEAGGTLESDRNGFAGIGIKTSPYQYCDLFTDPTRTAWVMEDVSVHDCYIHDVGGEGFYIGHGFYKGRKEKNCDEVTYSHAIKGIRIYDNLIEDIGLDGIQIKNADADCAVYNNVIRNYGTLNKSAHKEGLFIGGGTTGKFYNNYVIGGTGNGIQCQGIGNLDIFNNLIVDSGKYGFFAAEGQFIVREPDGYFNVINNTFINSGLYSFAFFGNNGGTKRIINNVFAVGGTAIFRRGVAVDSTGNRASQQLATFDFKNSSTNDFSPSRNSVLIDTGEDVSAYGILDDINGNPRPSGTGFDVGAFEIRNDNTLSVTKF